MKKWEFKKWLALWAVIVATAAAVTSYWLSAAGCDPAETVTTTVFTGCIGYLISYAGASLGEKVSRNRHGLDADGNPIAQDQPDDGDEPHVSG